MDILAFPAKSPNYCLLAAERVRMSLCDLACRIVCTEDSSRLPYDPLNIDDFLFPTANGTKPLKIVLKPKRLGNELWTESVTAFVYAGIERAFTKAGLLPGENRSGYLKELQDLRLLIEEQIRRPDRPVEKYFTQKAARLFRHGILEDRRRHRLDVLWDITHCSPTRVADLACLNQWIDQDLKDERLTKKGRPTNDQKIVFAAEIANLWSDLTGRAITRGPDSVFVGFLDACWRSGSDDGKKTTNFKSVIRHHIAEVNGPFRCGRCECCKNGEFCDRKRYFGTLT